GRTGDPDGGGVDVRPVNGSTDPTRLVAAALDEPDRAGQGAAVTATRRGEEIVGSGSGHGQNANGALRATPLETEPDRRLGGRPHVDDLGHTRDTVLEDALDAGLEGDGRRRAGDARPDELDGHHAGIGIDAAQEDVAAVGLDGGTNHLDDLGDLVGVYHVTPRAAMRDAWSRNGTARGNNAPAARRVPWPSGGALVSGCGHGLGT